MSKMKPVLELVAEHGLAAINPRAQIGDNSKAAELTPYEKVKKRIDDLVEEARLYADGAKVTSQELCDDLSNLQAMLRMAIDKADDARKAENKPFDDGKSEVQARYNLLIGETKTVKGSAVLTIEVLKKAQEPFLIAEKARKDAEAKRLRDAAEAAQKAAIEALRASNADNLAEREAAEQLVTDARIASVQAKRAENAPVKAGGQFGRSTSLRTVYTAMLIDASAALKHYRTVRPEELKAWMQSMADAHVRIGAHTADEIPGFTITSEMKL